MKMFFDKMDNALKDLSNQHVGKGNRRGGGGNSGYRKRKNVSKYCWTHGACAHSSNECSNKKPGHQDNATFSNKLGGSTRFCQE